jgi:TolA-binding protein
VQAAQAALADLQAEAAEAAAAAEARLAGAAEAAVVQRQGLQQRITELEGEVAAVREQKQQMQVGRDWFGIKSRARVGSMQTKHQ